MPEFPKPALAFSIFSLTVLLGAVQTSAQSVTPLDDLMRATQRNLQHLIQSGRYDEALTILQERSRAGDSSPGWARDWLMVLVHLGRRGEARRFLETQRVSGATFLNREWAAKRLEILERVFMTEESRSRYARAVQWVKEGRPGEAEPLFRGLREIESENLAVHVRLAQCLWVLGSLEASEVIDQALDRFGPRPELLLWKAESLLLARQAKVAVAAFKRASDSLPRSERAVLGLARAHLMSGNRKQAVATLRSSLDAQPHHVRVLIELARLSAADQQQAIRLAASRADLYLSKLGADEGDLGFPESPEAVRRALEIAIKSPTS